MYTLHIFTDWKVMLENDQLDEYILRLLNDYESLGPLPGILLPFIEAFLPFLPLIVFVLVNGAAYGPLEGFLWSWLGTSFGSILVFFIIRKLGNRKILRAVRNNRQVHKVTNWFERHGFGPLFLLMCFPFSPSSVINVVSGLSKISTHQFILAVFFGKSVMIFSIAYIGSSLTEFATNPFKTIGVGIGAVLFWILGKQLEKRIQKRSVQRHE